MPRKFKHPNSEYIEEVGSGDSIAVFFFGVIYLAIKGLWAHVFIWLILVVPCSVAVGGAGVIFFLFLASFIYALYIQDTISKSYLKNGWTEILEDPSSNQSMEFKPTTEITKQCPFCSEKILASAILCKHCRSSIEHPEPTVDHPA